MLMGQKKFNFSLRKLAIAIADTAAEVKSKLNLISIERRVKSAPNGT